ncbi:MAG: hypothetical protein M3032_06405 [Verrucomicrobiota bacterium]|nr:hypothetical protein [Verrucomicrobiota bacterium]
MKCDEVAPTFDARRIRAGEFFAHRNRTWQLLLRLRKSIYATSALPIVA